MNVTIRKTLGLYSNVRPCRTYVPYIKTKHSNMDLVIIRGVKVWPQGMNETFCTDHWRCRFMTKNGGISNHAVLWMLLREFSQSDLEVIKLENLYLFDGELGYSLGQGQ